MDVLLMYRYIFNFLNFLEALQVGRVDWPHQDTVHTGWLGPLQGVHGHTGVAAHRQAGQHLQQKEGNTSLISLRKEAAEW